MSNYGSWCWDEIKLRQPNFSEGKQASDCSLKDGGAEEIRTPDPHNAIVVLYQLSYDPIQSGGKSIQRRLKVKINFAIQRNVMPANECRDSVATETTRSLGPCG